MATSYYCYNEKGLVPFCHLFIAKDTNTFEHSM